MIQGITVANQAMSALLLKQDIIAHNLANSNTVGFKQSSAFTTAYKKYLHNNRMEPFVNNEQTISEVFVDYKEGALRKTGNDLDLAIRGSGFFTVMSPTGVRYTRDGNFTIDSQGYLVDGRGAKVIGTDGLIQCDEQSIITVTDRGEIIQNGNEKGFVKICDFKKPYELLRDGNGYFKPLYSDNPVVTSPGYTIKQGFLEESNTNLIQNMVAMISTYRNYEIDQKALASQDQTLEKAVNVVGKIS